MDLFRLVYSSRPFGFDDGMLNGILSDARHYNAQNGLTGALICRADLYLQWLEGPQEAVEETYRHIEADNRHLEVRRLYSGFGAERLFPDWTMRDDPARSWMWSPAEIDAGALARASADDIVGVFRRLAAEPA
jgi:hypothetical protein